MKFKTRPERINKYTKKNLMNEIKSVLGGLFYFTWRGMTIKKKNTVAFVVLFYLISNKTIETHKA